MPKTPSITVIESVEELKVLQTKVAAHLKPRIKMLLATVRGAVYVGELAAKTGVSGESIRIWKNKYRAGGLQALITEGRGGDKRSGISSAQKQQIAQKLADPKNGFRSYGEVQTWLKEEMGIEKGYYALNKYLKRNFATKLKVGRKSHVKKRRSRGSGF